MKKLIGIAVVLCLGIAGGVGADEPVKTPLTSAALQNFSVVLAPSSYNESNPERPILYYKIESVEVILPKDPWVLTPKNPVRKWTLRDVSCEVEYRGGNFTLSAGGKSQKLVDSGLGYESAAVPLDGGASYLLAFPREYSYEGQGHLFCRSGSVQVGTVDGTPIRLYDDDLDGRYVQGKDGVSVGDKGAMSIFGTLGELLPTTSAAYEIRGVAQDGSSLTLSRYAGPTGRLVILPIKDMESRLAFASEDGKCSFGTLADEQGLTLPAGKYRFLYGYVYRPSAKGVVALVLPSKGVWVDVGKGQNVTVTLGDVAKREFPWGEGYVTIRFEHLLEVDLTGVQDACAAGDFAKAQTLFDGISAKYRTGPNYEASKATMEDLRQTLAFETSAEGKALREAEAKVMAAVTEGKLDEAKALLPAAQGALAKIPGQFAKDWPYKVHKARVAAMARYAAGTSKPGLKSPEATFRGQDRDRASANYIVSPVPGKEPDVVATVDWETKKEWSYNEYAKYARRGWIYDGVLLVPREGQYELALESGTGGARLYIDNKVVIDHWGAHVPEERTALLRLAEGGHPLRVEMYTLGGTHRLHLWWTPPGGRKAIVPAWALEHGDAQVEQKKPKEPLK